MSGLYTLAKSVCVRLATNSAFWVMIGLELCFCGKLSVESHHPRRARRDIRFRTPTSEGYRDSWYTDKAFPRARARRRVRQYHGAYWRDDCCGVRLSRRLCAPLSFSRTDGQSSLRIQWADTIGQLWDVYVRLTRTRCTLVRVTDR